MLYVNNKTGVLMNKAAQLSAKLELVDVGEGMKILEKWYEKSLHFDVINDAMCILHDDGSANIIGNMGKGIMSVEVISAENILKVLEHYRPFKEVFKDKIH
jgi:hypothetical protein